MTCESHNEQPLRAMLQPLVLSPPLPWVRWHSATIIVPSLQHCSAYTFDDTGDNDPCNIMVYAGNNNELIPNLLHGQSNFLMQFSGAYPPSPTHRPLIFQAISSGTRGEVSSLIVKPACTMPIAEVVLALQQYHCQKYMDTWDHCLNMALEMTQPSLAVYLQGP